MPQWSPPRKAGGTGGLSFPLTFPDSLPQWSPPRKAGGTSTGFAANVDGWISRNGARPGRRDEPSATVTVLQPPFYTPQWSPPRKAGGTVAYLTGHGFPHAAAMEPAPEGGRNPLARRQLLERERAAMEPAPEGGRDQKGELHTLSP